MNRILVKALPIAVYLAFSSGAAHADPYNDTEGFHGYLRAGVGSSNAGGPQSCYGLGGSTMSYRLGNECDSFTEFGYTHELIKSSNGASFVGTVWVDAYKNGSDFGNAKLGLAKAYIEAKNLPFMNGATVWAGKRYYYRPDIHMLDLQYINLNGTGGGIDKYPAGPGTISYAVFKDNDLNAFDPVTGQMLNSTSALRQNLVYEGLPVNTNGTLDAALTLISAQGENNARKDTTHDGWQVSLFHKQAKVFGGSNTVGVQYGVGPGTGIGGQGNARIGSSGSTLLGSDVTRTRIFNDLVIQPTRDISMGMVALWQRDKSDLEGTSTWTTLGVRPVYALAENFKLQAEVGVTNFKSSSNPDTARLTKITLAPTISMGRGYWARPELRAFVSYGKWNDAATASVNAANNSGPVYGSNTSGTSVGLQVEAWF
jgi:maltoporin